MPVDNEGTGLTLERAAAEGVREECEKLVAQGENVNSINDLGWTPLMQAVRNGHNELARFLLLQNADVTICNHHGVTAFTLAVPHSDEELLAALYDCLGDVELREAESTNALQVACLQGLLSTATWLLTNTLPQVNMVSPVTGVTPLLLAMMGGHYDLAELLLKIGADKSIPSMLGQDVFQFALVSGDRKLLRLLQEDSPTLTSCFSLRVKIPEDKSIDPLYTVNNIYLDLQRDTCTLFRNSPSRPVFKTCDDDTEIDSRSRERLTPSLPTVFLSSPQKNSSPLSRTWDCNRLYSQYNIGGLVSPRVSTPKSPANSLNGVKKKKLLNKIGRPSWLKKLTKRRTRSVDSDDIDFNISKPNGFDFSQLLFTLGIDEFYSIFKEQELDMGTFLTLTIEDLESMGIRSQISQERILKSIKMLQKIQL